MSNLVMASATASIRITLLTWNVWFEDVEKVKRTEFILSECARLQPDIIAFQEVTLPFIQILRGQSWVELYRTSDDTETLDSLGKSFYGNYLMVKSNFDPAFSFHAFPTNMHRSLLVSKLNIFDSLFTVGTVHLESLSYPEVREKQLQVCAGVLEHGRDSVGTILCGDFNFW